jgi:hypothetical protein
MPVGLVHGLGGRLCPHLTINVDILVLLSGHGAFLAKFLLHLAGALFLAILGLVIGLHGILAKLLGRHSLAVVFRHVLHFLTLTLTRRARFTDTFFSLGNGHIRKCNCRDCHG